MTLTGTVDALPGGGALGIAEVSTAVPFWTVSCSKVVFQRSAWIVNKSVPSA